MKQTLPNQSLRNGGVGRTSFTSNIVLAALAVSLAVGLPYHAASQSDDFDDGDDVGWSRYDATGTANFSFPNGGYHIQGVYAGSAPLVFCTRSDNYTNFYAAVDIVAWDDNTITNARSAIGLAFRTADIGPGTTKSLIAYWTPAINGGGNRVFSIYYIWNDFPVGAAAATFVTLEPTNTYRMVVTGVGDLIEGKIYDLKDLTKPVSYISAHVDTLNLPDLPASGKCGLFAFSRNNTTINVTFDNYFAAAVDPAAVPAPGTPHPIPGAPQVVNRIPRSDTNFHAPTNGISFTATTLGGNAISGIQLQLNGADVSSGLVISGPSNNRSVSYSGLASNKLYQTRIILTETGGKSSTNDFTFDTFSDSYITSSAVKLVEAEDYNYTGGSYQLDPIPVSGYDTNGTPVNGSGVGYVDLVGTPDVDYFDRRTSVEPGYNLYRNSDRVSTFIGSLYYLTDGGITTVATNDTILQKFASQGLLDYQVQHTEGGEWLNYTRTFAPGRYTVYVRLSSFSPQDVLLDEVTSDRTQPLQTTAPVGKFHVGNTGHISTYRYFQLVDDLGAPKVLNWTGEKTFRLTFDGPQQDFTRFAMQVNYLMFVPASLAPFNLINPNRVGNTFNVSFTTESGVTYKLQYKNALSDLNWNDGSTVPGDGTVKSLADNSSQSSRIYRVVAY